MKTKTYNWGDRQWTFYKPKVNRKRQTMLFSLVTLDLILPMTFGLGIMAAKTITKIKPLFLYK